MLHQPFIKVDDGKLERASGGNSNNSVRSSKDRNQAPMLDLTLNLKNCNSIYPQPDPQVPQELGLVLKKSY